MSCKYNKEIMCEKNTMPCNGCVIEKAVKGERERILQIIEKSIHNKK